MLRSGEQFAAARAIAPGETRVLARPRSQSQRLAEFYEQTATAVAEAQRQRSQSMGEVPMAGSEQVSSMSVINLDYLRSGFQFEAPPLHSNQTPARQPKSTTDRLREYYTTTANAMGQAN
eukprot:TRINITY_DN7614_c0_g1_i1.p1 TRINITY_DN7614_c0_g1~~TRINITY_DN7614_c0_g1_i1.p1  ORF type:complete len:120 (+),score=23.74 TRINITY_DN7614_c0_g1_i1:287-646(+)